MQSGLEPVRGSHWLPRRSSARTFARAIAGLLFFAPLVACNATGPDVFARSLNELALDTLFEVQGAGYDLSSAIRFDLDRTGRVVVSDAVAQRVIAFTSLGELAWAYDAVGPGPGELNRPRTVGFLPDSSVFVVDDRNRKVIILSPGGKFEREVPLPAVGGALSYTASGFLLWRHGGRLGESGSDITRYTQHIDLSPSNAPQLWTEPADQVSSVCYMRCPIYVLNDGSFWVNVLEDTQLVALGYFDPSGSQLDVLRFPSFDSFRMGEAAQDRFLSDNMAGGDPEKRRALRFVEGMPASPIFPAGGIEFDGADLRLLTRTISRSGFNLVEVSPDGVSNAHVWSSNVALDDAILRGPFILGVRFDDYDVPVLNLFRLQVESRGS